MDTTLYVITDRNAMSTDTVEESVKAAVKGR